MVVLLDEMALRVNVRSALLAVVLSGITGSVAAQEKAPVALPTGPLTLEQVLTLAEGTSEALGIARTAVQRAEGEHVRARSGRFPQLTASASYDRALASEFSGLFSSDTLGPPCAPFTSNPSAPVDQRVAEIERAIDCGAIGSSFFGGSSGEGEDVDLPFGRANTWRVNLAFSQAIYSGGRLGAQADMAVVGQESAQLAYTVARGQLLFDVTRAFYDAALSDRLVTIAEATLAQADATVTQVQAGFEAGAQPEFELLRARVARDNQRPGLIRQRAARDIALLRLKQLLDLPADSALQIVAPLDSADVAVPAPFAGRVPIEAETSPAVIPIPETRTAVQEVESLVRLREASLRLTRAERRPSLSVTSNYSQIAYPSGVFPTGDLRTNWTLGASVQVPVLTGGRQRGSEAVARAELEQSRLQLRQAEELAQLDARSAHSALVAARAAFEASAGSVQQAARAYEIAEVRFQSGVSTQLELSDARLLLQQAEANRAQSARDLQVARAAVALLPVLPFGAAGGIGGTTVTTPAASLPAPQQQPVQRPQPLQGGARGGLQ